MERDRNESIAKEKEVAEMKRVLLDMKMYDPGYSYKQMKDILAFINESKDMANKVNDEKNAQKELTQSSNNCNSGAMSKTNLTQHLEIQEHNDASQSIHSYGVKHTSPIQERISTHGSPNFVSSIADSRNSVCRGKNLDSEDMFGRLQDNSNLRDSYFQTNRYSLRSKNSLQDSYAVSSEETRIDGTHSEYDQKLKQWQINPLDSYVGENDVALKEPKRPSVEDRMPFKLCKEAQTSEEFENVLLVLNNRFGKLSDAWHSWPGLDCTTDNKIQWGSPIQVGIAKEDNSDRKPLSNSKTEQNQTGCINKCSNEHLAKRKSTLILSPSDTRYSSSDDDEMIFKKRKTQSHEVKRVLCSNVHTAKRDEKDQNSDHETDHIRKLFDDTETENSKTKSEGRSSPKLYSLPSKRFAPPNVRKRINKKKENDSGAPRSPLAHSSNEKQSAINLLSEKKGDTPVRNEEIVAVSNNANENIQTTSDNVEIKPLPMKGLSRRIRNECTVLKKIELEKRKELEIEEEEVQKKKAEQKKRNKEFFKKQLEERQKREKEKQEKEKYKEEKSKKWNTVMETKLHKKITKSDTQRIQGLSRQNEVKTPEIEDDRMSVDDDTIVTVEMQSTETNVTNSVDCPICNKSFPTDRIEAHAAGCEQFVSDNEYENDNAYLYKSVPSPVNTTNEMMLECNVCSKYKTTNGIDYEEHVNNCLQKKYARESSSNEHSNEIINIPDSPVRCYRPISEQTDSYIDYKKQFPSCSKTQVRKRKR